MSFIGYSDSGYRELAYEITYRKGVMLDTLDMFSKVEEVILESWKGHDADGFVEDLREYLKTAKEGVTEIYDEMQRHFEKTYNEWVQKQKTSGSN